MIKAVNITRKVLFGDCDPAGSIYTPRYSDYTLQAVHQAFDTWLGKPGLKNLLKFNVLLPVRALSFEFYSPLTWDDELVITVKLITVGQHSLSFEIVGRGSENQQVFLAQLTLVLISADTKDKAVVPDELRRLLS